MADIFIVFPPFIHISVREQGVPRSRILLLVGCRETGEKYNLVRGGGGGINMVFRHIYIPLYLFQIFSPKTVDIDPA
jgi:hypothetical protein